MLLLIHWLAQYPCGGNGDVLDNGVFCGCVGGYTEQFDNYSSSFVEETEGEFELMLTSSRSRPIELDSNPANWNASSLIMMLMLQV